MPKKIPLYVERNNPDAEEHRRKLADSSNQLQDVINSVQNITLDASTVRTQFSNADINEESFVGFTPRNANAANELASGSMYISTVDPANSTWTIDHSSTSTAVFTFTTVIIG